MGQGAFLLTHLTMPPSNISIPAILKIKILYLEKMSNWGTLEINPAKTAPDPMVTKSAGKAQQIKVPKLVNKLIKGTIISFLDVALILKLFSINFRNVITCIYKEVFYDVICNICVFF